MHANLNRPASRLFDTRTLGAYSWNYSTVIKKPYLDSVFPSFLLLRVCKILFSNKQSRSFITNDVYICRRWKIICVYTYEPYGKKAWLHEDSFKIFSIEDVEYGLNSSRCQVTTEVIADKEIKKKLLEACLNCILSKCCDRHVTIDFVFSFLAPEAKTYLLFRIFRRHKI